MGRLMTEEAVAEFSGIKSEKSHIRELAAFRKTGGQMTEKTSNFEPLVDKTELCKVIGVPESTVDYWRRNGKISGYGFGRQYRYRMTEVFADLKKG